MGDTPKNVVFFIGTPGAGNTLIREMFTSLGFKEVLNDSLILWPCYLKAVSNPKEVLYTRAKFRPPGELSNEEALRKVYANWGYHPDSSEVYSEDFARQVFRQIITERIKEGNLLLNSMFQYTQPLSWSADDGTTYSWSQAESDRAFGLLVESLDDPSIHMKYLGSVRHPLSLYLSMKERFGETMSHQERVDRINSYLKRIEDVRSDGRLNRYILKYEDLCGEPEHFVRELVNWAFPDVASDSRNAMVERVRRIPQRASRERPRARINGDLSPLRETAERLGYAWEEDLGLIGAVKGALGKYAFDMRIVAKVIAGNLDAASIIHQHPFSLPARATLRLMRSTPVLSSRLKRLRERYEDARQYTQ